MVASAGTEPPRPLSLYTPDNTHAVRRRDVAAVSPLAFPQSSKQRTSDFQGRQITFLYLQSVHCKRKTGPLPSICNIQSGGCQRSAVNTDILEASGIRGDRQTCPRRA